MKTKTAEQIAVDAVHEYGFSDYPRTHCIESGTAYAVALFAIRADRAQRAEREPEFAPADEPDEYRDLWDENMPRVSSRMYFAVPGEQPIHLDDDEARHILAYLSEKNR